MKYSGSHAGHPAEIPEAAGAARAMPPSTRFRNVSTAMSESALPRILPVFPLTGVLLLPGMLLPLHIFEPRYLNMVRDALAEGRYIGMIQPVVPRQDNRPPSGAEREHPELYAVGCAGSLEAHQETPDGRYLIHLRGQSRFRVTEELPLHEGYRRVRADYAEFAGDSGEPESAHDPARLLEAFAAYAKAREMRVDAEELRRLPGPELVNSLAMSLPYAPAEKQALLEAKTLAERETTLIDLLTIGSPVDPLDNPVPPRPN